MENFGSSYAGYYNLLYKDKDYDAESEYLLGLIKDYSNVDGGGVLDIGCGTGKHLELFRNAGYKIAGVDLSENMINAAKERLLKNNGQANLQCANACSFRFEKQFDVVTSLFHVVNYITTNDDLNAFFENVSKHLVKGGIFIFDFWYGPAVLTDLPVVRVKRMQDENYSVTRIAEPVLHANENIVDVNFEIMVKDLHNSSVQSFMEQHRMRYLFYPELEQMLSNAGFSIKYARQWMKDCELSFNTWYGCIVAKKE